MLLELDCVLREELKVAISSSPLPRGDALAGDAGSLCLSGGCVNFSCMIR